MNEIYKKKKYKYKKIVRDSIEGRFKGFAHRSHRTRKNNKACNNVSIATRRNMLNKIKSKEHQEEINKYK